MNESPSNPDLPPPEKPPQRRSARDPEAAVVPGAPTAKARACYELRRSGRSWGEIAKALGLSKITVQHYVARAINAGMPRLRYGKDKTENTGLDEMAGRALAAAIGPEGTDRNHLRELLEASGMSASMIGGFMRRLSARYGAPIKETRRIKGEELIAALEEKTALSLKYIDDFAFTSAPLRDSAYLLRVLIESQQLLGGKPTQIYDVNIHRKIEFLIPQFLAEAKRRGITVEGTFSHAIAADADSSKHNPEPNPESDAAESGTLDDTPAAEERPPELK